VRGGWGGAHETGQIAADFCRFVIGGQKKNGWAKRQPQTTNPKSK
jgi:hypothetical protein